MNKEELREKRNRTIESLNDIKAMFGLDELYIDELEKELADAKKVQVVEHFEAYGQCRDSRRIAELEQEKAGLKAKNKWYSEQVCNKECAEVWGNLTKATDLLKWFVWYFREGSPNLVPYKHKVAETEQFISEVEK